MRQPLKHTPLHDLHVKLGAKMAPFCGWHMPIDYPDGVLASHLWTRQKAGLFDVSHMGQVMYAHRLASSVALATHEVPASIRGKDRIRFIEGLVVSDIGELAQNQTQLSVFTNEKGGIKDDTMITNAPDHLYAGRSSSRVSGFRGSPLLVSASTA